MSKLIVEMEIRKNCLDCDLHQIVYGDSCADTDVYCFKEKRLVGKRFGPTKDLARPSWCPIKGELVMCGKCYYKDEKRIMDEDALWCRKHHMYVTADWFCADGDRKIEAGVYVNGEVAFINGGPEDENEFALDETEDVDK